MASIAHILVPVDGSAPSLAALAHAVALAEDCCAKIDILHVQVPEEFSVGSTHTLTPEERDEAERALDDATARLGACVSRQTVSGEPLRTIIETARDGNYDLIVLGTHGRVGRLHALLGSVAEGVVRNAPCPVLTVRDTSGGYQSFAERRHGRESMTDPHPHHSH